MRLDKLVSIEMIELDGAAIDAISLLFMISNIEPSRETEARILSDTQQASNLTHACIYACKSRPNNTRELLSHAQNQRHFQQTSQ